MKKFLIVLLLSGCATIMPENESRYLDTVGTAEVMIGLHERENRAQLRQLMGVDPVDYEWCAAFVNMILEMHGIPGSASIGQNPLAARGFLKWGTPVGYPKRGDIVVFPRGKVAWQGHVGFYIDSVFKNGKEYYRIIGGNQDNNRVSIDLFPATRAIGIRRQESI